MEQNRLRCNKCGKEFKQENNIIKEDFAVIKKSWGYFSKKDGKTHRFFLCEDCYDSLAGGLLIPVEEKDTTELL